MYARSFQRLFSLSVRPSCVVVIANQRTATLDLAARIAGGVVAGAACGRSKGASLPTLLRWGNGRPVSPRRAPRGTSSREDRRDFSLQTLVVQRDTLQGKIDDDEGTFDSW